MIPYDVKQALIKKYSEQIMEKYCICPLCGRPIVDLKDLSLDHIIPESKNGPSTPENLQPAHAKCNNERGANILKIKRKFDDDCRVMRIRYTNIKHQNYSITIKEFPKKGTAYVKVAIKQTSENSKTVEIYYGRDGSFIDVEKRIKKRYYNHSCANYRKSRGGDVKRR